jgi:hypothetical protein
MSADSGNDAAWLSNGTYPASSGRAFEPPDLESAEYPDARPDVPTIEERIRGLLEEYPERCMVSVSEQHGVKLREEALSEPETREERVSVGQHEEIVTETVTERSALPLIAVVEEMLEWYESYRDMYLRMGKGDGIREPREEFLIALDNSYSGEYQERQYARLKALKRQLLGGEYPSGEEVDGEFVDPVTVLFTFGASGYRESGDSESGLRPICDHDRSIREAWTGSSDSVRRTLRYVLEDKLGLSSDAYAWWWQSEPHPGDGTNAGYSHSHPVVVFDGAAASVPVDDVSEETFRAVVAKHVAECEGAEWSAHELEDSVEVRTDGDIEDFAGYVSEYIAIDPDTDLLERSDKYLMYAASQWATTTQKYSRDRVATDATKADACHQEYCDPETQQMDDHGDVVVRSRRHGVEFECIECGSAFGIDQTGTLTEHRLNESAVSADGGEELESESGETAGLRSWWSDARGAAVVGGPAVERECDHREPDTCPLCATETESPDHTVSGEVPIPESAEPVSEPPVESCGFSRSPKWEPVSIVKMWSEEETVIGAPSGTVYGEVVVPGAESLAAQLSGPLPPVSWLEGPEPWERHPVSESAVRSGDLPPPEVIAREERERYNRERVTSKRWPDDWYERRYEREESEGAVILDESERERIEEFLEREPEATVAVVMGRLGLSPEVRSEVSELL